MIFRRRAAVGPSIPSTSGLSYRRPLSRRFNRIFHGGPHLSWSSYFYVLFYSPAFEARYRRGRAHTRRIWKRERERRDATRRVESSRTAHRSPIKPVDFIGSSSRLLGRKVAVKKRLGVEERRVPPVSRDVARLSKNTLVNSLPAFEKERKREQARGEGEGKDRSGNFIGIARRFITMQLCVPMHPLVGSSGGIHDANATLKGGKKAAGRPANVRRRDKRVFLHGRRIYFLPRISR